MKIVKYLSLIFAIVEICSCSLTVIHRKDDDLSLNKNSIKELNIIFKEANIKTYKLHNISSGYLLKNPKLDERYVLLNDTSNFVFFKLFNENKGDSLIMMVNRLWCFATIAYVLNGYVYPNQSVIIPHDYSFLVQNNFQIKIKCSNHDNLKVRRVGFSKLIMGKWQVDSIHSYRKKYKTKFKIRNIEIEKKYALINGKQRLKYNNFGYFFALGGTPYTFFKVLVNRKYLIMINTYNNSYEEFYLSRIL